jgi:glycosyltransferase involved in cell wall biosynthesis
MTDIDLLVVGPTGGKSGGIGRYISEQMDHLDGRLSISLYNTKTTSSDTAFGFVLGVCSAILDWLRFPFRDKPNVVHVHTSHYFSFYLSSLYVLFAAYVWQIPVVLHVHGSSFDEFVQDAPIPVAIFQSIVFEASDAVIVLSDYWRKALSERVSDQKVVVLPNAVNIDEYDPQYSTESQQVVFVSTHIERKGIVEMTDSVGSLLEQGLTFDTTIAGTGPLSHHAEELAATYEDVDYIGYVSEQNKRALLDRATIYVLPTYAEGLPIAILEAMAGGNAIVTTNVGSIPSAVDETNGRLVTPGDVEALTEALQELITDPRRTRRMCETSRDRVETEYAWVDIAEDLEALYRRLIDTPAPEETSPVGTTASER